LTRCEREILYVALQDQAKRCSLTLRLVYQAQWESTRVDMVS
jgi:hypothetical protein